MIYDAPEFIPYSWQNYCTHHLNRYNVVVAPRQHGKTTWVCELINTVALAPNLRNTVINLCSDTASRLFTLYSQRLGELFRHNPLWSWPNSNTPYSRVLKPDGSYSLINFIGSISKPTGCTGTPAHLNIVDEAALVSLKFILESAMPATDKTEGITVVTGTVADNQYRDLFKMAYKKMMSDSPHWFAFYMRFGDRWSREALNEGARAAILDKYDLDDPAQRKIFDTQYMCRWDAGSSDGRPYADGVLKLEDEGRVIDYDLPEDPILGTTWDDGRGCTAVWVYTVDRGRVIVLGYREWLRSDLVSIAKELGGWFRDNRFRFGVHCLPHTMEEKSYTQASQIDRRTLLRNLWKNEGYYLPIPKVGSIESKLQAGKSLLEECQFSKTNIITGLPMALSMVKLKRYARDQKKVLSSIEPVYLGSIKKDGNSHAGDAFGELALGVKSGYVQEALQGLTVRQMLRPQFETRKSLLSTSRVKTLLHPY